LMNTLPFLSSFTVGTNKYWRDCLSQMSLNETFFEHFSLTEFQIVQFIN
jgi:hypothetical protein